MFRTAAVLVALAVSAGCIALPDDPNATLDAAAAMPPAEDRIEGMTAESTQTDAMVDCSNGGLLATPAFCAERVLEIVGRVGIESLLVDLVGTNGAIEIRTSEGDTWSFTATIRVRALTEEMAREGLDTAWTWSHESSDGSHAFAAGPVATESMQLSPLEPRVVATTYELALPAWLAIDLDAQTDNGAIAVDDRMIDDADLETDNGQIVIHGSIRDLSARTDNGQIVAALRPFASGKIDLSTDNGQVILKVPESRDRGYDIEGKTDNGQVVISLRDCEMQMGQRDSYDYTGGSASCKTSHFEDRAIQTLVVIETNNAQIMVSPL